jgi:hypothetical protein
MAQITGWLIDLYPNETGLALWLLGDNGARHKLHIDFPVTFYAAGAFQSLRQAWRFLQSRNVSLARETRRDLFSGERAVLAVTVHTPAALPGLFAELSGNFQRWTTTTRTSRSHCVSPPGQASACWGAAGST